MTVKSGISAAPAWLLSLPLLASSCHSVHPANEGPGPQVVLHGVQLEHFQAEKLAALGHAGRIAYERFSDGFTAYDATILFPSRGDGGVRSPGGAMAAVEVKAPEIRGNLGAKQADGLGGVLLRTRGGMVGRTAVAHFDGAAMTAGSRTPVTITGPGYALTARDFFLRFEDEMFEFNDAQTTFGEGAAP